MIANEGHTPPTGTELDGLPRASLGRPAWYCGHIARVRRVGAHRLLLLHEEARDGTALAVWVSSVALDCEHSTGWAELLDAQPLPTLAVRFRSRFPSCSDLDPLTADVHFPEDIGISRCGAHAARRSSVIRVLVPLPSGSQM